MPPHPPSRAGTSPPAAEPRAATTAAARRGDEERVLEIVRELARETGGARAASAVTPTASLERDIGLGSLERVELLSRLEGALGREAGDGLLLMDTPRELAVALAEAAPGAPVAPLASTAPSAASAVRVDDVATVAEALLRRATAEPARVHAVLHEDSARRPVTYGELWEGAARIAGALAERGVKRGETVGIMLPTGLDFLQTFMGVLAAGAVAVPLYPPWRLDRLAEYLRRQSRILANAESRLLVAGREALPLARLLRDGAPSLQAVVTADALRDASPPVATVGGTAADAALVQYTSGSTGDPKGVLLTHANLLANIRAIAAALAMRGTDSGVSWLPLYHDMGLIGTWLCTLVEGIPLTLLSPLAFLARPERWLWAIHERRATLSAAPNFAFELCVRKVKDEAIAGLDLSSWRCALNGSEPVSAETLERFAARFARYGFRREALMPVYGLAESSVALCIPPLGRAPLVDRVAREPFEVDGRATPLPDDAGASLRFVSVGVPIAGHDVRLLDGHGAELPDRVVGRLVFRGPSCMAAYFRNPEATARTMLDGGWLDSGDLAYRAGGELFITGRAKDLIIKGGRNIVPQEVEEEAGAVEGIRKGCVAAFGLADARLGTERLVVVAESRLPGAADRARLAHDVVARVASAVGVPPDDVRIVPPGTVPKTPSGKIRRGEARTLYAAGRLGEPPRAPLRLRARLLAIGVTRAMRAAAHRASRVLYIAALAPVWVLAAAVLVPVVSVLVRVLSPGRAARRLSRACARVALALCGCRVEVEGRERLARTGPLVLVSNHTSYADVPSLLAALPIDVRFVTMLEILGWPVVGTFARRGDHPLVDRFHPRRSVSAARQIEDRLRGGQTLLFFPEGTFAAAAGLRPFRLGAFEAAVATRAPVVPLAVRGAREVLRSGTRFPHPRRIHVWVGEPIAVAGEGWSEMLRLRDRAAEAIAAHCGEPRLDLVTPRTER